MSLMKVEKRQGKEYRVTKKQVREYVKNNKCPKCSATTNITKSGRRYNIHSDIQIFRCKSGRHFFSMPLDLLQEEQWKLQDGK